MTKVYVLLRANTFTSETYCNVYSTKEKATARFLEIINGLEYDEVFDNCMNESLHDDNMSAVENMEEFRANAMEDLNCVYNGDSDTIEELSVIAEEVQ